MGSKKIRCPVCKSDKDMVTHEQGPSNLPQDMAYCPDCRVVFFAI